VVRGVHLTDAEMPRSNSSRASKSAQVPEVELSEKRSSSNSLAVLSAFSCSERAELECGLAARRLRRLVPW